MAVIRVRGLPTVDPYSQEVTGVNWGRASRAELPGAVIAPQTTTETAEDGRVTVRTFFQLLLPGVVGEDIADTDRFEFAGKSWMVEGDVLEYVHPFTGWTAGTVVNVVRVGN